MIGVKVNEEQLQRQLRALRGLAAAVADPTEPNRRIAIEFDQFVMRNFQTEGGMTEQGRWAELEQSTIDWKERHGYSMILQNAGELRDSFMMMYSREYAGIGAAKLGPVSKAALKAARESDKAYDRARAKGKLKEGRKPVKIALRPPDIAAVHEYGSDDGRIPARPMLPTMEQALGMAMRVYNWWIETHKP